MGDSVQGKLLKDTEEQSRISDSLQGGTTSISSENGSGTPKQG